MSASSCKMLSTTTQLDPYDLWLVSFTSTCMSGETFPISPPRLYWVNSVVDLYKLIVTCIEAMLLEKQDHTWQLPSPAVFSIAAFPNPC